MEWTKPGRIDAFRFVRVSWPGFAELGEVRATDCEYAVNRLSDLHMSGSATLPGGVDMGDDLLRAYSVSTLGGETAEICHFTMMCSSDETAWKSTGGTTDVTLYSTLKVLQDELTDETLTVPKGTDAVAYARTMCEDRGLTVQADEGGAALAGALVFDPGTTRLSVLNRLLSSAGFASARVDAYGRVVMTAYSETSGKTPAIELTEAGGGLLCSPEVNRTRDTSEVCNVVTLTGTDADGNPLRAQARNDSETSRWSTVGRGRVISRYEEIQDATTQAALESKAANYLKEETTVVETVELTHFWQAFEVGDAIRLALPSYGLEGTYSTTSRKVTLGPGMKCVTSARRFADLEGE